MYIFEINPLSVASFAIIFSQSEGCLFTLLIVSFGESRGQLFEIPENLIRLACQVFSLMALLGVGPCVLAPGTQPRSLDFADSKGTNWEKTKKKPIRGIHWED